MRFVIFSSYWHKRKTLKKSLRDAVAAINLGDLGQDISASRFFTRFTCSQEWAKRWLFVPAFHGLLLGRTS